MFLITERILPTKKSNFITNYHITSIMQYKGHFAPEQCNYYIKKCCTVKVGVQYLVLVVQYPFFLCSGHTSKITWDQEHCTHPTASCLPIRARLTWGVSRRVGYFGIWQVLVFGQIFIKIKVVIVFDFLNMFLVKGKPVFSMLCKMMKHSEVIFWGNQERNEVDSDCVFLVWWWLVYYL